MQCNYPNTKTTSKSHFNAAEQNARITNATIGTLFSGTWSESNNSESETNSVNRFETLGNEDVEKSDSTETSLNLISLGNNYCGTVDSFDGLDNMKTMTTSKRSMETLVTIDFADVSLYVIDTMNLIVKEIDELFSLFLVNRYVVNNIMKMNKIKENYVDTLFFIIKHLQIKKVYKESSKLMLQRLKIS